MKLTKFLFSIVLLTALALLSQPAQAQRSQVYTLLSGGTTALGGATTNLTIAAGVTNLIGSPGTSSNLVLTVAEYANGGLTWQYVNTATSTNANVGIRIYKSMDNGVTFESTPTWVYTNTPAAPGSLTYTTVTNLSFPGVTHLAFTTENNTAGHVTNVLLKVNLQATKVITRPGTQ